MRSLKKISMRRRLALVVALVTAVVFVVSVAVPAFGGPKAHSSASARTNIKRANRLSKAAIKRSARSNRTSAQANTISRRVPGVTTTPTTPGSTTPIPIPNSSGLTGLGFALVGRTGGVSSARTSSNIQPINVGHPHQGVYCLTQLPFTPKNAQVTINNADLSPAPPPRALVSDPTMVEVVPPTQVTDTYRATVRLLPDSQTVPLIDCPADSQATVIVTKVTETQDTTTTPPTVNTGHNVTGGITGTAMDDRPGRTPRLDDAAFFIVFFG